MTQWYFATDGKRHGPVSENELRDRIAAGEVSPLDLVWREGMGDWQTVGGIPELATSVPPPLPGELPGEPLPGQPLPGYAAIAPVPNYLWQSIVVTILCCLPLGIPAIYHATKVDNMLLAGDVQAAVSHSGSAKGWSIAALVLGLLTGTTMSIVAFVD